MKKLLCVLSGVLMFGAFSAQATVEEEIAARLMKEGSVCVQGDDCASASGGTMLAAAAGGADPAATYKQFCTTCHAIGVANAPKLGDKAAWEPRIAKGMDALYNSAINGLAPGMPAKGMCFSCSDDDLKATVDYMVEQSK